ncbi:hypothetical protein Pmani_015489 [Petrolisthes manimaculis]|uniref:Uncharacterized protein n=1 Tax=Petrolisthes manimaculis TaxID=1843537 RepID=A0AAE1PS40_9EUCA|nr:hypothetical protein Pmani_015489 [Petrolisthes manimaculis]
MGRNKQTGVWNISNDNKPWTYTQRQTEHTRAKMLSKVVFVAILSLACAASVSVENRQGPVAQARDTHGGGGGGSSHSHSHGGGGGGGGGSSYSAPAPATSYDDGGSQGNLYYYYYPVTEHDSYEVSDGGFDIFAAIILPLLILGGILLLLSSLTFTLTGGGRALSDEPQESSFMDQLHDEIERVFYIYLNAFESEQCLQRTICEIGAYSKELKGKDFVLDLIEPLVPEGMKGNMAIFKKAASSGYETGKCKKFRCVAPKLL